MLIIKLNWWFYCMFAGWVIYKFQYYIWDNESSEGVPYGDEEYRDETAARIKTYRKVSDEYPEHDVDIYDDGKLREAGEGDYGNWMITATRGLIKFIFLPVKKD